MASSIDYLAQPFLKASSINNLPPEAWTVIKSGYSGGGELHALYQKVPWAFRAVDILANAYGLMPFSIYQGKTVIDSSDDYQNKVGFLPNPAYTFGMIAASQTIWGASYFERRPNLLGNKLWSLEYLVPSSIKAKIDKEQGLTGFERTRPNEARPIDMGLDELFYFWRLDPWVEVGPPKSSALQAGAAAGGVLLNVDQFAAAFFARGAIKATVFTVKGPQDRTELDKLKDWVKRIFQGIKGAFGEYVLNADQLQPTIIGEGLESLAKSELTNEKKQDISVAVGIPYTILFSGSASGLGGGGVSSEDTERLYTQNVIPNFNAMAYELNRQVFSPIGLSLKARPEAMNIFQADETSRASSLTQLTTAGIPLIMAMRILGYDLQDEQWDELELLAEEKKQRADVMVSKFDKNADKDPDKDDDESDDDQVKAVRNELTTWRRYERKRGGKGREFVPAVIPPSLAGAIQGSLDGARTAAEKAAIFDDVWASYP